MHAADCLLNCQMNILPIIGLIGGITLVASQSSNVNSILISFAFAVLTCPVGLTAAAYQARTKVSCAESAQLSQYKLSKRVLRQHSVSCRPFYTLFFHSRKIPLLAHFTCLISPKANVCTISNAPMEQSVSIYMTA